MRRADARIEDDAALDRLLEPLPEAEELRVRLRRPLFVRAWDADAQRDYWVQSDGMHVRCLTLSGLTLRQAAAVRVRWDALRAKPALTAERLADLIAEETGAPVTLVG